MMKSPSHHLLTLVLLTLSFVPFPSEAGCVERGLTFFANAFPPMPGPGSPMVWGGNATDGDEHMQPPFSPGFLSRVRQAKTNRLETFAYLEGPCGDTDGVDDGERDRCQELHSTFNRKFAKGTPNTPQARWKPYTMAQLRQSGDYGIDYCEVDNLKNNVTIPLIPFLREVKTLYEAGKIHCRLVLKNLSAVEIETIKQELAPSPSEANFLAPFHIFEANNDSQKTKLDNAMRSLKGTGAKTIISTCGNRYGACFTPDRFLSCN